MSRKLEFAWLDVFTRTPLEGNQLAVYPNAQGLTGSEMQSIAREMHLSETTFVFPKDEPVDGEPSYPTRIFTVSEEMPFAGHPTLGTAAYLSESTGSQRIVLDLKVGRIPVQFSRRDGVRFGEMKQIDPVVGQTHDRQAVANALNVDPDEIDPRRPIQTLSTGSPFAIVPFRSRNALSRVHPDWIVMNDYLSGTDAKLFYLIAPGASDLVGSVAARMFFWAGEDPATGSAAGPAVAWMVLHAVAKPGQLVLLEQGLEIRRRSQIFARADFREGRPCDVRVGGHVVLLGRGEMAF